jgi:hypothetical protein
MMAASKFLFVLFRKKYGLIADKWTNRGKTKCFVDRWSGLN